MMTLDYIEAVTMAYIKGTGYVLGEDSAEIRVSDDL